MGYSLIAFDMDGTLLDSKKRIGSKTLEAIEYACSKGKTVVLSTGRCLAELDEYLPVLKGVRYLNCVSGGYVYDTVEGRYIYTDVLSDDSLKLIFDVTGQTDCMVQLMNAQSVVSRRDVRNMSRYGMGLYRPMFERVTTQVDDVKAYWLAEKPPVMKVCIYHTDPESREQTLKMLDRPDIETARSETTSAECTNRGVTKGKGLEHLCAHLGISLLEAIAVGDAENDMDMLRRAGLGIAMGNAKQSVKDICGAVVDDNDHDGCAQAIYDYLMR